MAITLEATYSKKLGLAGYSSHQYSVTIRTELTDMKQVEAESSRLYALLQGCVDTDIQKTGFLPANGNSNNGCTNGNNNGSNGGYNRNGNHSSNGHSNDNGDSWFCSDKQKSLILKIVDDHGLDKRELEDLALERFNKGVRQLNKMEASGFIEELIETYGGNSQPNNNRGNNNSRFNGNNGSRFKKARVV
jgi:hypothetical protein